MRAAPLVVGALLLAACATVPPAPAGVLTGRVTHVEVNDGFITVQWNGGASTVVMVDRRAAQTYHVGDVVRFDRALRPLGRS